MDCGEEVDYVTIIAPIIEVRLSESAIKFTELYIAEVFSYPFLHNQGKLRKARLRDPT